jgi:hypothetical protein
MSNGDFILAGYTESPDSTLENVYLLRTDANGNAIWEQVHGDTNKEWGLDIENTSDGGFIVTGMTETPSTPGNRHVFLMKTGADGSEDWTRIYENPGFEGWAVSPSFDGGYVIAANGHMDLGDWLIKTDSIGDTLWTRAFCFLGGGLNDVVETQDSGYVTSGYCEGDPGIEGKNFYVSKVDSDGNWIWSFESDLMDDDVAYSVEETHDGGFIIAGYHYGLQPDIHPVKLDADGDSDWTATIVDSGQGIAYSVTQTLDGGYIIGGTKSSPGQHDGDAYVLKINAHGDTLWSRTYGGTSSDGGADIAKTSDGGYILVGGTRSFGQGSSDVYLLRMEPGELCGDGRLTTGDAFMILNYLGSGPQPVSCWAGNVNGKGGVSSADGFTLLGYFGSCAMLYCGECEF